MLRGTTAQQQQVRREKLRSVRNEEEQRKRILLERIKHSQLTSASGTDDGAGMLFSTDHRSPGREPPGKAEQWQSVKQTIDSSMPPSPVRAEESFFKPNVHRSSMADSIESNLEEADEDVLAPSPDAPRWHHVVFALEGIVRESTKFRRGWNFVIFSLILYSVIMIPYRLGFEVSTEGTAILVEVLLIDSLFFIDMILNMFTHRPDEKQPAASASSTASAAKRALLSRRRWRPCVPRPTCCRESLGYFRSWFVVDFFSTIPFDILLLSVMGDSAGLSGFKLVRTVRLARLLKLFRVFKLRSVLSFMATPSSNIAITAVARLTKVIMTIMFVSHLLACVFHYLLVLQVDENLDEIVQGGVEHPRNWLEAVNKPAIDFRGIGERYLLSLYWVVATLMAVGFGDIHAVTTLERGYSIFSEILGAVFVGIIIANTAELIETLNAKENALARKLDEVREYMLDRKLPRPLQRRILDYFTHFYSQKSLFNESDILSGLSKALQHDVVAQSMGKILQSLSMIKDEDPSLLSKLVTKLKPAMHAPGDMIAEEGDIGREMFFLTKGAVDIIAELPKDFVLLPDFSVVHVESLDIGHLEQAVSNVDSPHQGAASALTAQVVARLGSPSTHSAASPTVAHSMSSRSIQSFARLNTSGTIPQPCCLLGMYTEGHHFGDVSVFLNQRRPVGFRASVLCNIQALSKQDIEMIFYDFPDAYLRLQEVAKDRLAAFIQVKERVVAVAREHGLQSSSEDLIHIQASNNRARDMFYERQIAASKASEQAAKRKTSRLSRVLPEPATGKGEAATPTAANEKHAVGALGAALSREDEAVQQGIVDATHGIELDPNAGTAAADTLLQTMQQAKIVVVTSHGEEEPEVKAGLTLLLNDQDATTEEISPQLALTDVIGGSKLLRTIQTGKDGERIETIETEETVRSRCVLHPNDPIRLFFDMLMAILILVTLVEVPFIIGFAVEESVGLSAFDWSVDCIFVVDLLLSFRTAFVGDESSSLDTRGRSMAWNFLTGNFPIDMVSSFPFDSFIRIFVNNDGTEFRSLKLLRTVRLVRLLKLFRFFRLRRLTRRFELSATVSPAVVQLGRVMIQVVLATHLLACALFFASVADTGDRELSAQEDHWWTITTPNNLGELYVASVYFAFTTMATVGYGDLVPRTSMEIVFTIIAMFVGATMFGYIVGSVAHLVARLDVSGYRYQAKITEVLEYLHEKQVSKPVIRRVMRYYDYYLTRKSAFDEDLILAELSDSLRRDVVLFINMDIIKRVPYFFHKDREFVTLLVSLLQPQYVHPGVYLYREGEVAAEMYFLIKGQVEIVANTDEGGEVQYAMLEPGSYFGELALLMGIRRSSSARAVTHANLFVLTKDNLRSTVAFYPQLAEKMEESLRTTLSQLSGGSGSSRTMTGSGMASSKFVSRLMKDVEKREMHALASKHGSSVSPVHDASPKEGTPEQTRSSRVVSGVVARDEWKADVERYLEHREGAEEVASPPSVGSHRLSRRMSSRNRRGSLELAKAIRSLVKLPDIVAEDSDPSQDAAAVQEASGLLSPSLNPRASQAAAPPEVSPPPVDLEALRRALEDPSASSISVPTSVLEALLDAYSISRFAATE
jgi:CRP-like cAMP-binding protein